jgi:small-conductance mechanosensitive channel
LVGLLALLLIFVVSMYSEPFLISFADGAPFVEPRSSAGGWADSNLWLGATGTCCLALIAVGYVAKRLSPLSSQFAVIALIALVVMYVFFAQFPATKSAFRIALWFVALPGSLVFGAWLAFRSRKMA